MAACLTNCECNFCLMKKSHAEDLAYALLREVIARARQGEPYKEHMAALKEALEHAPGIAQVVRESLTK